MTPFASAASEPSVAPPAAAPVVIVGAGLAGLTVALRLARIPGLPAAPPPDPE